MRPEIVFLESILRIESGKRENRSLELLRIPTEDCPAHWAVYLPAGFNAALDIELTDRVIKRDGVKSTVRVWTQGSTFAFSAGDILYDTKVAYDRWSDALKSVKFVLEVVRATSAVPVQKDQPRYPGHVVVRVSKPNSSRTSLEAVGQAELSQDDFVRFVMTGEGGDIRKLVA